MRCGRIDIGDDLANRSPLRLRSVGIPNAGWRELPGIKALKESLTVPVRNARNLTVDFMVDFAWAQRVDLRDLKHKFSRASAFAADQC